MKEMDNMEYKFKVKVFSLFFMLSYSLLDSIEDEMKLVVTVNKFRCSTSSIIIGTIK